MTSLLLQQLCSLQQRSITAATASGTASSILWGQCKPALCLPWSFSPTPSGPEGCSNEGYSSFHLEFTSSAKNVTNPHLLAVPSYWKVSLELTGLKVFPKTVSARTLEELGCSPLLVLGQSKEKSVTDMSLLTAPLPG